jgi:hypothetical protein
LWWWLTIPNKVLTSFIQEQETESIMYRRRDHSSLHP